MRLLFVKLKHIGDTLVMTPALTAAKRAFPESSIWTVVRKGTEDILSGCPAIDRVLTTAAPERGQRRASDWWKDARLICQLRRERFDYAFELTDGDRGRFIAWLSGARVRVANNVHGRLNRFWRGRFNCISMFNWQHRHAVERDFYMVSDGLPLGTEIPRLSFERSRTQPWPPSECFKDFVVIHPATRWKRKQWRVESWIQVGRTLLDRVGAVVISTGPDPEEVALAREIQQALPPRSVLSTEGKLSWSQMAGLLYRAKLMVACDTAALHLAAACQCPAVGLFCPASVENWRPWQVRHRVVADPQFAPLGPRSPSEDIAQQTVAPIRVEDVLQACEELIEQPP